jgi:hypothetical protein
VFPERLEENSRPKRIKELIMPIKLRAAVIGMAVGVTWWTATGGSAVAASAPSPPRGVIFPDDLDDWKAQILVGRPGNFAFVQGPATEGGLAGRRETGPGHIVFDRAGNMYVACDTFIQVVSKDGLARVLAGTPGIGGWTDGPAAKSTFAGARDLAMTKDGAIYVVDEINQVLRRLEKKAGGWQVTTVAGVPSQRGHRDGPARQALFDTPFDSVAVSDDGIVFTMDANWLRKHENGVVTTLNAGTGSANGPLARAQFNRWMSQGACLSFGNDGELYVADRWNMAIRKVDLRKGEVTTFAGAEPGAKWGNPVDGPALDARFHGGGGPYQVLFVRKHGFLLAKSADEDTMRIIKDGRMMTFGFTGPSDPRRPMEGPIRSLPGGYVTPIGEDPQGNIYVGNNNRIGQIIRKVTR